MTTPNFSTTFPFMIFRRLFRVQFQIYPKSMLAFNWNQFIEKLNVDLMVKVKIWAFASTHTMHLLNWTYFFLPSIDSPLNRETLTVVLSGIRSRTFSVKSVQRQLYIPFRVHNLPIRATETVRFVFPQAIAQYIYAHRTLFGQLFSCVYSVSVCCVCVCVTSKKLKMSAVNVCVCRLLACTNAHDTHTSDWSPKYSFFLPFWEERKCVANIRKQKHK